MADSQWNLNYRIVGRRSLVVDNTPKDPRRNPGTEARPPQGVDMVDVEWSHKQGFPADTREISIKKKDVDAVLTAMLKAAVTAKVLTADQAKAVRALEAKVLPSYSRDTNVCLLTVEDGTREVIADQINVPEGTPDSICMQILEEKRPQLAKALGIEP